MKIKKHYIDRVEIEDFADKHGLVMEIHERTDKNLHRFWANFSGVEVKDSIFLVGEHGNGDTPNEAIQDYARSISNKTIVVNAFRENRREIEVPILTTERIAVAGPTNGKVYDGR